MKDFGRRNTLITAMIIYIVAIVLFALASYAESSTTFFWISVTAKFVKGIGASANLTATYAIICSRWPENKQAYLALAVITQGVALCLGPLIGSAVYSEYSYRQTQFFFVCYIIVLGLVPAYMICESVDNCDRVYLSRKNNQVTFTEIFDDTRSCLAILARFLGFFFCAYFEPTLALELKSHNVGEQGIGIVFASTGIAFSCGAVLSWLLS